MELKMLKYVLSLSSFLFILGFSGIIAPPPPVELYNPDQGFFAIVNGPELGRSEAKLYLYAIHTSLLHWPGEVQCGKKGGLVGQTLQITQTGPIPEDSPYNHGGFLSVGLPNRNRGSRYGTYTATYTPHDGSTVETRTGFVKPPSARLDTRGVYTHTVWPAESGDTRLSYSPDNNIGVRLSPSNRRARWCKGRKRNVNIGPRLELKTTDDAGIYTIRRGKRGVRGWFVQIEVIAARCQVDQYYVGGPSPCDDRELLNCMNGGVLKDAADECTCPPFFTGTDCSVEVNQPDGPRDFVLAAEGLIVRCGDLPGGNPKCREYLICFDDLYGCKCAPGWWGNNCDQACSKGKWGVGCSQNCPNNQDCDRFFGP